MKQFSYSKLSAFEPCPKSYYFKYLTNLKPDREDNIEAFMGSSA